MVEANHSLQEVALQARLAQATITLARQQAEKAVKRPAPAPRSQASVHREAADRCLSSRASLAPSRADRRGEADC